MASTNIYVPEELRNQILSSLPVKSLLRFKSVCKSWNKLISSKSFCYSHLAHNKSSSNKKRYILFDYEDFYSAHLIKTESSVDVESSECCYKPKLLETSFVQYGSCYMNVYGICNGILCLSDGELRLRSTIYLWNPIARRGKKIPNPYETDNQSALHALAFGYHDDDYKVIKMARFGGSYFVYIYSLSINDWKFVRFTDPDYKFVSVTDPDYIPRDDYYDKYMQNAKAVLVNNAAYFLKEDPCQVVCFDISNEIIRTVNFPEDLKAGPCFTMKAYGESIALLDCCESEISTGVVMWILSEKLMWEKRFSVEFECSYPLGFTDDGEIMVRAYYYPYKFMLFNIETNQFTELKFQQQIETLKEWKTICGIDSFVESLVLFDKSNMDEYFVKKRSSANTTAFTLQKWKI